MVNDRLKAEMERWRALPRERPKAADIVRPGPGQESVWDYPRPPRIEPVAKPVRVVFAATDVVATTDAVRVVETAGAPVYYIPPADVRTDLLRRAEQTSLCEWKGEAAYWSIFIGASTAETAAWSYPSPEPDYAAIRDYVAFYPGRVDACYVGDEKATPQPGGFYGGWVTSSIVGPIKGVPGSEGW